jgi:hypothetical protein
MGEGNDPEGVRHTETGLRQPSDFLPREFPTTKPAVPRIHLPTGAYGFSAVAVTMEGPGEERLALCHGM